MGWIRRVRALFGSNRRLSQDLEDELNFHLSMREQLNGEQGMPSSEARRNARIRFGSTASLLESMREIDVFTFPGTVWQDVRYGARMLAKNPGFSAIVVLALTLGISVNTAVFTAYKAIVARSLDARDPGRMVNISITHQSGGTDPMFSYPDYLAYRDETHSFDGVIAAAGEVVTLSGAGSAVVENHSTLGSIATRFGFTLPSRSTTNAELIKVAVVSENYFSVLGVTPSRGRAFDPKQVRELTTFPSVLISDNYWRRRFATNPAILGKSIRLNGVAVSIIGITRHNFVGTDIAAPDVWIPLALEPLLHSGVDPLRDRENQMCRIFGRLRPGVSTFQARAEVTVIANRLRMLHDPHSEAHKPATAEIWPGSPFGRQPDPSLHFAMWLIMAAVGMVLVIACANVASLQLARAASRQSEIEMRVSLGASRFRVIRQLLTESVLLGLICGLIALLFTWALLTSVAAGLAEALPPEWGALVLHVTPDLAIFAYVFAISLLAGVLFGLAPALECSRSTLSSSLKEQRIISSGRNRRLRSMLTATQVAVCLVLLIAGSLLIRGSIHALSMETGYDGKHVINMEIDFPDDLKFNPDRRLSLSREIRSRIEALPSVAAVATGRAPDGDGVRTAVVWPKAGRSLSDSPKQVAFYTYVSPNYFRTLGIPMLSGGGFSQHSGAPDPAVILSASQAAQLWPGQNPIGRKLTLDTTDQFHAKSELVPDGISYQVIGVVRDSRGVQLDSSDDAQIYLPLPDNRIAEHPLLVRTRGDAKSVMPGIGSVVSSVEPDLVAYTATLDDMLHLTGPFVVSRCAAAFASVVGIFGLLLASLGIYGTVSYVVVLRTNEMGLRMALGASRGNVLSLILRESTRPVVAGLAVGLAGAFGVSRLLHTLLYGLGAVDVVSFAGVSLSLLAIALFAAYVPSRRALRVDPATALRYE